MKTSEPIDLKKTNFVIKNEEKDTSTIINTKIKNLKQLKQYCNNNNVSGLQELIDIGDYIPPINSPKKHYLLNSKSKLNYVKIDWEQGDNYFIHSEGISFNSEIYFVIDKEDLPQKGNQFNYTSAFTKLKNRLKDLLNEYEYNNPQLVGYKEISKISDKLKKYFNISTNEESLITIKNFINDTYSMVIFYKEIEEDVFNYCIYLYTKPFNNDKEYTNFKRNIKKLYNEINTIFKDIIRQNAQPQKETKTLITKATSDTIQMYKGISKKRIDNATITKNFNIKFTNNTNKKNNTLSPFDDKFHLFITRFINKETLNRFTSEINLSELYNLRGDANKKEFLKRCKESLINFQSNFAFELKHKDAPKEITIFPFKGYMSNDFNYYIIWNEEYLKIYSNNFGGLKTFEINKKLFAIPDKNYKLYKLNAYINRQFYFKKKGKKYTNQHKDENGIYILLRVDTLIEEIGLKQEETFNNKTNYNNIKTTLTKLLDNESSLIDFWNWSDSLGNEKDTTLLKPKDYINLHLKLYIDK